MYWHPESNIKRLLSVLIVLFSITMVWAQRPENPKTYQNFQKALQTNLMGKHDEALRMLDKVIKKEDTFTDAYWLASDICKQTGNTAKQMDYLQQAARPDFPKYDQTLIKLLNVWYLKGEYQFAQDYIQQNDSLFPHNKALNHLKECIAFSLESVSHPNGSEIQDVIPELNTPWHDYWPSLSIDGKSLVTSVLVCDTMPNGNYFCQEDIYFSQKEDGKWTPIAPVGEILNTEQNEGGHCLTADGRYLFFTACNRPGGQGSCDIYYCHQTNGKWSFPQLCPPPMNTKDWEGHPSVDVNGSEIYFSSDRPGGQGGKDLWKAKITYLYDGQLKFSELKNLGPTVNTTGDDISPFIHFDGQTLFFSSDGHVGLGRQDIFKTQKAGNSWATPVNMGYPINTHNDDIGFVVEANGKRAWMASERARADKDVYSLMLPESLRPFEVVYYKGIVRDKSTKQGLSASVELFDLQETSPVVSMFSDDKTGEFLLCLKVGEPYAFHIKKRGYLFYSQFVNINRARTASNPFRSHIDLEPVEVGNIMVLENVFFETGSFDLKSESEPELQQLMLLFEENPELRVEIRGHTDSVGAQDYNLELSTNRAKAVYQYLIDKGIKPWRLEYKGYGDTQPIATNDTEEGRAKNRRTEAMIIR